MSNIIRQRLDKIRSDGLYRSMKTVDGVSTTVTVDGKQGLLLCSNNYLGLADHPGLKEAAARAASTLGTSTGASRLVSGNIPLYQQLEQAVSDWKQTEAALTFNSGYAANTGIISALAGRGDLIFSDRLNHASIIDGALLSGARFVRYPHNDPAALDRLMEKHPSNGLRLIVTDGVFSMDGDLAPLKQLVDVARKHDALLMVDDAHGSGLFGAEGRGTADLAGCADGIDIQMGTFGKGLGSYGAYAATSALLREYLINRARSLVFSTSLPPAVIAATIEAIRLVRGEEGELLRNNLANNVRIIRQGLKSSGFGLPDGITPIIPIMVGDPDRTMQFSKMLLDNGVFLQGIRPPTVPVGTSRLRCTVMATHTADQLQYAVTTITSVGRQLGVI